MEERKVAKNEVFCVKKKYGISKVAIWEEKKRMKWQVRKWVENDLPKKYKNENSFVATMIRYSPGFWPFFRRRERAFSFPRSLSRFLDY